MSILLRFSLCIKKIFVNFYNLFLKIPILKTTFDCPADSNYNVVHKNI